MSHEEQKAKLAADWEEFRQAKAAFEAQLQASGAEVKLFVGNLDPASGEEQLAAHFNPYGLIKEVVILKDRTGVSKRSGFVKFYLQSHADAAIAAVNDRVTDGTANSPMVCRIARPKAAAAPPFSSFSGSAGGSYSGYGMGMQSGMMPNYGGYNANAAAQYGGYGMTANAVNPAAIPMSGYAAQTGQMGQYAAQTGGSPYGLGQMAAASSTQAPRSWKKGPQGANIYVNNLDLGSRESDLRRQFGSFGTIVSCKAFGDKGYGFVSYETPLGAQRAIQAMNGAPTPGGQVYAVSLKTQKPARYAPY